MEEDISWTANQTKKVIDKPISVFFEKLLERNLLDNTVILLENIKLFSFIGFIQGLLIKIFDVIRISSSSILLLPFYVAIFLLAFMIILMYNMFKVGIDVYNRRKNAIYYLLKEM